MADGNIIFSTSAWVKKSQLEYIYGLLSSDGKNLVFDTETKDFKFNITLNELKEISYPWYYFGGAFKAKMNNRELVVTFVTPNGQVDFSEPELATSLPTRWGFIKSIGIGRKKMSAWRKIFETFKISNI